MIGLDATTLIAYEVKENISFEMWALGSSEGV